MCVVYLTKKKTKEKKNKVVNPFIQHFPNIIQYYSTRTAGQEANCTQWMPSSTDVPAAKGWEPPRMVDPGQDSCYQERPPERNQSIQLQTDNLFLQ